MTPERGRARRRAQPARRRPVAAGRDRGCRPQLLRGYRPQYQFNFDGGQPGAGGTGTLLVNGETLAEGRIDKTVGFMFSADETMDIGSDTASPVIDDYGEGAANVFIGGIDWVQIDVEDDEVSHTEPPDGEWRDVEIAADAEQGDGLVVYRQELPIVFLNARRTADRLRRLATDDVLVVLLDATAISSFDSTGIDAMVAVRAEVHEHGIELWTVNPSIRGAASVDEEARIEDVAPARRFHHLDEALAAFEQLDGDDE